MACFPSDVQQFPCPPSQEQSWFSSWKLWTLWTSISVARASGIGCPLYSTGFALPTFPSGPSCGCWAHGDKCLWGCITDESPSSSTEVSSGHELWSCISWPLLPHTEMQKDCLNELALLNHYKSNKMSNIICVWHWEGDRTLQYYTFFFMRAPILLN